MIDHVFYDYRGPRTLQDLLTVGGIAQVRYAAGASDKSLVRGIARLDDAGENDLAMLHNVKYIEALKQSKAGFCIVSEEHAKLCPNTMTILISPTPYRSFGIIADAFYPNHESRPSIQDQPIHPTAKIGEGCVIEYGAVVQAHAEIGANTKIFSNAVIGQNVKIGENCNIGAGVKVCFSYIGNNVIIYPGATIGQSGFGFFMDEKGHVKVPQLGRVIIEDNVEIGANTTIDRGSMDDTIIGRGTRIDNLVQIAHNVKLGKGCVIVAQVGISGSTQLGDYVIAAGQAGIIGHLKIGSRAKIAAQSGVLRDVGEGEAIAGSPAVPVRQWHRQTISLSKLTQVNKRGPE